MRIHILAFLLLTFAFFACQQVQELDGPLAAGLYATSANSCQQAAEKTPTTAVNIIYQSTDGGQTWQDISVGLPEILGVGSVFAWNDEVLLGTEEGVYRRNAGIATPHWENDFLMDKRVTAIYPGRSGPYVTSWGNGFFRILPGSGIWIPMHQALKDKNIQAVLESPDGALFVACDSGIYKSVDDGKSWRQVFDDGQVMSLSASNGMLFGGGTRGVLRANARGEQWDWVLRDEGAAVNTGNIEGGIAAITYDGDLKRLYTSTDTGNSWQQAAESDTPVRLSTDIKQAGEYLFYSEDTGVFRSADKGKSWQLVFPVKGKRMFSLVATGQTIYAITMVGC